MGDVRLRRVCATTLAVVTSVLLSGCGDSTGPTAASITLLAGDAQTGLPGWELAQPIAVAVHDRAGKPLPGAQVSFYATSGGGFAFPETVESGPDGVAATRWTLGGGGPGLQALAVTSADQMTEIQATALEPDAGDVLVVHGALGPLRAAVLTPPPNTLEFPMGSAITDTVIPLPPLEAPGRALLVLGHQNAASLVTPAWTAGQDTVHVQLAPPIEIALTFIVRDGTYAARVTDLEGQVQRMEDLWSETGVGIEVAGVSFVDQTASAPTDRFSPSFCGAPTLVDDVQVEVLTSIDLGVYWGYTCPSGHVFITGPNLNAPQGLHLLAHEIGHLFGLTHTLTGLMKPSGIEGSMTVGEAFLMNFARASGLNTIFSARLGEVTRDCGAFLPGNCLLQGYDLPD